MKYQIYRFGGVTGNSSQLSTTGYAYIIEDMTGDAGVTMTEVEDYVADELTPINTALALKLDKTEPSTFISGQYIQFDKPRSYGDWNSPYSVFSYFSETGAVLQTESVIYFNGLSLPSQLTGSTTTRIGGNFVPGVVNKITAQYVSTSSPRFEYTIEQRDPSLKANDSDVVKLTGNQTVGGNKNYTGQNTYTDSQTFENSNQPVRFTRLATSTNNALLAGSFKAKTSADMANGFGAFNVFYIEDSAGVENNVGAIGVVRDGADNSGKFVVQTRKTGTGSDVLTIDSDKKATFFGLTEAPQFKLSALNTAPASATATGVTGEVRITSTYIYVCIATNTWVRAALATW